MMLRTPDQLVDSAVPTHSQKSWFNELSSPKQKYVTCVVEAMIANPNAAFALVARELIEELQIDRHEGTIIRTLKEMISDAKKKTK